MIENLNKVEDDKQAKEASANGDNEPAATSDWVPVWKAQTAVTGSFKVGKPYEFQTASSNIDFS